MLPMIRKPFQREQTWRRYLRFWGPAPAADIDDEFAFHIQSKTDELIGKGWDPTDARREAERTFGPMRERKRECLMINEAQGKREARRVYGAGWWRDLRYATRVLWKTKVSTASAVLILAISTGASTAVFTVLDATIFKPLPVANADRLVRLQFRPDEPGAQPRDLSSKAIELLRGASHSLKQITRVGQNAVRERAHGEPDVNGAGGRSAICVTGNYFDVLGVHAQIGRTLQVSDDSLSADPHVAVASYGLWRERYGLSPEALGKKVYFGSVPFTIIGFLPEDYRPIRKGTAPSFYIPMAASKDVLPPVFAASPSCWTIGLLDEHITAKAASAELNVVWERLKKSVPTVTGRLITTDASRGIAAIEGERETSLFLVATVIGLMLLIGCVNVSCLLVARGAMRRNEFAIRRALGAGAVQILRQSLVESCLLALVGGGLGLALAASGERLLLAGLQWGNQPIDLTPDGRVLGFSLTITLAATIFCGIFPALQALRTQRLEIHREGQLRPLRSGKALIAMEVALSLVLLAAAGMFLRGVGNLRSVPVGFNPHDVSVIRLFPNYDKFPDGVSVERYLTAEASRLRDRLESIPGLERAAFANGMTFSGAISGYFLMRLDGPVDARGEQVNVNTVHVDDRFFDVLDIPVKSGRPFSRQDDATSDRVVILSESVARKLFGNQNPVGQRVSIGYASRSTITSTKVTAKIVGVAGDTRQRSLREPVVPTIYLPFWQPAAGRGWSAQTGIHIRTPRNAGDIAALIDKEIKAGGYPLSIFQSYALEDAVGASYQDDRIRMQATAIFASIALVLIVAGIYGLMAYAVKRRSREIGIRMAVGATSDQIVGLVLKDCMTVVAIGLTLGIPGALAVMRVLSAYVFELSPTDPATLGGAIALMLVTAGLAAAGPAWRSTQVNPVETLRTE